MANRLLLVDSDRAFLKEHQVSLESAFEVEVVNAPDQVMPRLESGAFAAVMICVEVADNRGYALCASVRRNAKLAALKVILISAKATEDEYKRHQTLKGRADLYLMKPLTPGALVAALSPLVPSRGVDPDNPLGDLADNESDNDWLGDLKDQLVDEPEPAPAARPVPAGGTVAISADQLQAAMKMAGGPVGGGFADPKEAAKATAPPAATKSDMAQQQVDHLGAELKAKEAELKTKGEELKAKDAKLRETEEALAGLQRQLNSVTVNLDDLERQKAESADLQRRLQEAEAALQKAGESGDADSLRTQVREAIQERKDLLKQIDDINQQLTEKTQRTIELLKEKDRLQSQALEADEHKQKAQALEQELGGLKGDHATATAKVAELEPLAAKLPGIEKDLGARMAELKKAQDEAARLDAELKQLGDKQSKLEAAHAEATSSAAAEKEKAETIRKEMGGLEATVRGQGRELAELGSTIATLETKAKATEAELKTKEESLKAREEAHAALQRELTEALARHHETKQALEEAKAKHEGEKLELGSSLAAKESELTGLRSSHGTLQEAHGNLEREKQGLHGQLAERQDRIKALGSLLEELADKLRQGAGLTKD